MGLVECPSKTNHFRNPQSEQGTPDGLKITPDNKLHNHGGSDFRYNDHILHNAQSWSRVDLEKVVNEVSTKELVYQHENKGKPAITEEETIRLFDMACNPAPALAAVFDLLSHNDFTDNGIAVNAYKGGFYNQARRLDGGSEWILWQNNKWESSTTDQVKHLLSEYMATRARQYESDATTQINANTTIDDKERKSQLSAVRSTVKALNSTRQRDSAFSVLKGLPPLQLKSTELDIHKHLLGTPRGVIDLKTASYVTEYTRSVHNNADSHFTAF